MTSFCDLLQWYNTKDVVSTLEATQKMIEFYHDKGRDISVYPSQPTINFTQSFQVILT